MGSEAVYAARRFSDRDAPSLRVAQPPERARFEQILNRQHRRLRRTVAGLIADPDRVDDVLQEAYLKAFRGLPPVFANEAHEATWLYRIVYRCCLDELRRHRRSRESSLGDMEDFPAGDEGLDRLALEEAFRTLNPADRAVLLLVGVAGLDYDAAAAVLDVPRGTLAWRLSTVRARFRAALTTGEGG